MVCIRKPEVKTSWNCTEAYCAITANAVDSLSARKIFSTRKEFRSVLSVVVVKPDVVLYEEGLNQKTLQDAVFYISHADMLIVGGTSLAVYPAAGLIDYYRGNKLVLINKSATPMDARADLLIQDGLGNVFSQIKC